MGRPHKRSALARLKEMDAAKKTSAPVATANTGVQDPHTAGGAKGTEASSRETDEGSGLLTHTRTTRPHGAEENKLTAAGWTPNERSGKTIWQSPENGSWYSQQMALQLSKEVGAR